MALTVTQANNDVQQQASFFTKLRQGARKATHFVTKTLRGTAKIATQAAYPIIAGSTTFLFSAIMEDRIWSKIVGGTGCMLLGGYLTAKSAVPKILIRKIFGLQNAPQQKMTSDRVFAAVSGATIFLYGASNFVSGVKELIEEHLPTSVEVEKISTREHNSDKQLIQTLVSKIRACPEANNLWKDLEQEGGFSVKLGSREEIPHYAMWDAKSRIAFVQRDMIDLPTHDAKIHNLLFEMCNAKTATQKLIDINTECAKGDMDVETFVKGTALIERHSVILHHKIAEPCSKSQNWVSEVVDVFKSKLVGKNAPYKTEKSYWENYQNDPFMQSHIDTNIKQWWHNCGLNFCAKHKTDSVCRHVNK